jgi:hypothetical protein
MEFKAVYGLHHVLEPIGYGILRKTIKRGAPVRSSTEQFAIHSLASMFSNPYIQVVKPLNLESSRSYTMEHIWEYVVIPEQEYSKFPNLFVALMEFQQYMALRGYWAWGYKVLWNQQKCYIVDYSRFGTIDRDRVRFPDERGLRSVENIEERFHLVAVPAAPADPVANTVAAPSLEEQLRAPIRAINPALPSTPLVSYLEVDFEKIEDWGLTLIDEEYFASISSTSS